MAADNELNSASGNKQAAFAGTNPDKYGDKEPANVQDDAVGAEEAQNVAYDGERISGEEAEKARNKAMGGIDQGRDTSGYEG